MDKILVIAIAGPSSSGKTTLSDKIQQQLGKHNCFILHMDNYYKSLDPTTDFSNYNFDSPEAFNILELQNNIRALKTRKPFYLPQYNFSSHSVENYIQTEFFGKCIIIDGIFALHFEELSSIADIKLFIDTDLDTCLMRRIKRDVKERGRSIDSILEQYERFVKPAYYKYIIQQRRNADIIIPNGGENIIALELIQNFISERCFINRTKIENTSNLLLT